jgi:hypothetical protein
MNEPFSMASPGAGHLAAETETDRLNTALAQAQAELQRQSAALAKLQGELMASRLEVSGARAETVQFQGFLSRAEAEAGLAYAQIMALKAHVARDAAEIVALRTGLNRIEAERDALRASFSWRISVPIRVAGGLARRARRAAMRSGTRVTAIEPQPTPAPDGRQSPPPPVDPNAPYIFRPAIFKPGPVPSGAPAVVTLDELYKLSRSL